jgi:hypothetical protein
MHPLILSGLSSIGTSLLDQTLNKIRNNERGVFNFKAIMQHLSRKGCAVETVRHLQADLLESIKANPLLNEFRNKPNSTISIALEPSGRCIFKEDGQPILTCSRDSSLGKLGLAYYNLSQLGVPASEQAKEVYLENIA